jgi:hypothetical protein
LHEVLGQVHDPRPDPICKHEPDQGEVLLGHSVFAVIFELKPGVFEPSESIFIKTADRIIELAVRNKLELTGIPAYRELAIAIGQELIEEAQQRRGSSANRG